MELIDPFEFRCFRSSDLPFKLFDVEEVEVWHPRERSYEDMLALCEPVKERKGVDGDD